MKTEKEIKKIIGIMEDALQEQDGPAILEVPLTQIRKKNYRIKIATLKWVLEKEE